MTQQHISGWEAKRAGPAITIKGWTDAAPGAEGPRRIQTKAIGIRRIYSEDGLVKAEAKDGSTIILD